ncbi:MAG: autotransporter-associated beta strand repeat-containing protein [Planctomycetota bacterium]|nr:autotransporter-associated beta strand repeat-containing protein [Planctomycetota bacterium]
MIAAAALSTTPALAQEWIASTPGLWNDPANWSTPDAPNAVGASATILHSIAGGPITTGGVFTFNAPVTIGSLTIDSGFAGPLFTLAPQQLILDNGGGADVFLIADGSLGVDITGPIHLMGRLNSDWGASNGVISGSISGDYGILHDPPFVSDRLRLWGNNTYTGETRVINGRLSIETAAGLGAHTAGTTVGEDGVLIMENLGTPTITGEHVTLEDGGKIWARYCTWAEDITLANSGEIAPWFDDYEVTISGKLTGAATFIRGSAQSNVTTQPTFESILFVTNTANDYTDGTVIRSGVLSVPDDAALGAPATPITFDIVGFSEGPPALATSADTTIARTITLLDDGWLRADANTTGRYANKISGARNLQINFEQWTGAVELAADNDYTGSTTVVTGALIVSNNTGSATGPGPVTVRPGATLAGDGAISGAVTLESAAAIMPGDGAGDLHVGNLTLASDSLVSVALGGVNPGEFGQIAVTGPGAINITGDLIADFDETYTPTVNDEFPILTAAEITGTFATTMLPDGVDIEYTPGSVILRVTSAPQPCPTDFNADGVTNGADLGQLLGSWGPNPGPADLTNDGVVNGADLGQLLGSWGPCP